MVNMARSIAPSMHPMMAILTMRMMRKTHNVEAILQLLG